MREQSFSKLSEAKNGDEFTSNIAMKLDLQRERGVPLREVPQWIPKRNGKKVHYSTVYRWVTKGARGRVLESILIGGIRYTTVEAIERFVGTGTSAVSNQVCVEDIDAALRAAGL